MSDTLKLESGREAFRNKAWSDAYRLLKDCDGGSPLETQDLEFLAITAYLIGRDKESIEIWIRAHKEYLESDKRKRAAYCAFWLGMQLLNIGERSRGSGWITRAGRLLDNNNEECVEKGFLLLPVAIQQLSGSDGIDAYITFEKATRIGLKFENLDLVVLGRLGCGQALIQQNRIQEGTSLLDEVMITVETEKVSPVVLGIIYCAVVETCQKIYDLERAREWTGVLSDWCASQPDLVPFRGQCLVRRAEIMQAYGHWSDAMTEVIKACTLLSRPPGQPAAGAAYYIKAEIHRLRGEFREAEEAYREASRIGQKHQPGLALLRLAQGQVKSARTMIVRMEEVEKDFLTRSALLPAYIEIMLATDDISASERATEELKHIADTLNSDYLREVALRMQATILLARREYHSALNILREAWQLIRKSGLSYEIARIRVLTGLACRELGDVDTAEMEFDAARIIFRDLGVGIDLAQLDSIIHTKKDTHGLSRREVEILRYISSGKTNRVIASELNISERTVDRHVSNILMKLDVASRTEATAFAFKHSLI